MKHPIGILHRFGQIALLAVLCVLSPSLASPASSFPQPIGYVSDYGRVLSPKNERRLAVIGAELERKTGIRLRIVTLPSLQGASIEEAATMLLDEWSESPEAKSHTILILDAMAERKMRIEMGSELLSVVTPEFSVRIQQQVMLPHMARGEREEAYLLGVIEIAASVGLAENVALYTVPGFLKLQPAVHRPGSKSASSAYELLCCAVLLFFMAVMMRLQNRVAPATQVLNAAFRERVRARLSVLRRVIR